MCVCVCVVRIVCMHAYVHVHAWLHAFSLYIVYMHTYHRLSNTRDGGRQKHLGRSSKTSRTDRREKSAVDFVMGQVLKRGGMLELHKLGTLLNQKHPEMKKKVGKLRAFLDRHANRLRVISSHDANGSPSDFVMLSEQSAVREGRLQAKRLKKNASTSRGIARGGQAQKLARSVHGKSRESQLEKLHRRADDADPVNMPWDGESSEEFMLGRSDRIARASGARKHAQTKKWSRSAGGGFWKENYKGLRRSLDMDDDDGLDLSDSHLPIGTL